MTPRRVSVVRRLVDYPPPTPQPTPCRLWQGPIDDGGYGRRPDMQPVHRWVWEQINGPIPSGLKVLHRCDQPLCYRLDHLFLGTQADNVADRDAKGRASAGAHHHFARLTEDDVRAIFGSSELSSRLASRYGVSQRTIQLIRSGRTWKQVTQPQPPSQP